MAKAVTKSGLAGKLGAKLTEAVLETKDNETKMPGGGSLPAPIDNGIAQLVDCRFGQYKEGTDMAGEYFFYAAGVMVAGDCKGVPVKGLRTSIGPEPMCDTPKRTSRPTVKDHLDWVLNELRKLGADTSGMESGADVEPLAAAVLEAAPYFRVTTFQPKPQTIEKKKDGFYVGDKKYKTEELAKKANPYIGKEQRPMETWRGIIEGYVPADDDGGVDDDTAAEEDEVVEDEAEAVEGETSLEDLAAIADEDGAEGQAEAQAALAEAAAAVGVNSDEIETWAEVVEQINAASEGGEPEEESEEGEEGEAVDYEALGAQADEDLANDVAEEDSEAQTELRGYAESVEVDADAFDTWAELAAHLSELAAAEEGEEEAEEEEVADPVKGEVCQYKPKGSKKAVDCEVTLVMAAKRQVKLKNLTTKKPIAEAVSFDDLIRS